MSEVDVYRHVMEGQTPSEILNRDLAQRDEIARLCVEVGRLVSALRELDRYSLTPTLCNAIVDDALAGGAVRGWQ